MYSTVPGIGKTRVIGRPLGLLTSDIGISPFDGGISRTFGFHNHRLTRWHWNLMWLFGVAVCSAAAPDGVACVVWGTASSTICRRSGLHNFRPTWFHRWRWRFHNAPWFRWSSHTKEHLNLVSCTWRHSSHTSHQKTSKASPDHLPQTSPTTLHIPTWIEVSTCEVLDLARARSLQAAKSHFGSFSGTVDSTLSGHPRLVENVPTAKPRVGSPIAQLDDPLVIPHHTSFPDIA